MKAIPNWMRSLTNLVKVFLKSSRLSESPLEAFANLPKLVHIELLEVYTGNTLSFGKGKFQNLKILGIRQFNSLESVTLEETTMPVLERFTIERCERMRAVPIGIEHLAKLKVLEFINMPRELITTMHPEREAAEDYWKVEHIPMVHFTYDLVDRFWTERLTANTQIVDQLPSSHNSEAIIRK